MMQAIGGFFGEEPLGEPAKPVHPRALRFVSARAAFHALLRAGAPERVYLPWYGCPAMAAQAQRLGITVVPYALARDGGVHPDVRLAAREWIVVSDHFGLRGTQVADATERFPPECVVVDLAQSWHAPPASALATIYSPRKFVGLPDGGLLLARIEVPTPPPGDEAASARRAEGSRLRERGELDAGLAAYRAGERELEGATEPDGMSAYTSGRLDRIDFAVRRARRAANFARLAAALDASNGLGWHASANDAPLCYPMLSRDGRRLRTYLAARGIFCPLYWPGLATGDAPGWEHRLLEDLVCLPVDHRQGEGEMDRVAHAVLSYLA